MTKYTVTLPNIIDKQDTTIYRNIITTNTWFKWLDEQNITKVEMISNGYAPHTFEFENEADALAFKLNFTE